MQINITTCQELQNIQLNLAGNYFLGNNINCSDIPNFAPIGNSTNKFTGILDGKNLTISDLNIVSNSTNIGLFSQASLCTVKNLVLKDFNINTTTSSASYVGSLIGSITGCNIDNIVLNTTIPTKKNTISGTGSTFITGG